MRNLQEHLRAGDHPEPRPGGPGVHPRREDAPQAPQDGHQVQAEEGQWTKLVSLFRFLAKIGELIVSGERYLW